MFVAAPALGSFPFLEVPPSALQARGTWDCVHPPNQGGSLVRTLLAFQKCPWVGGSLSWKAPGPGFMIKTGGKPNNSCVELRRHVAQQEEPQLYPEDPGFELNQAPLCTSFRSQNTDLVIINWSVLSHYPLTQGLSPEAVMSPGDTG